MRRIVLGFIAAVMVAGCSTLQGVYDDEAEKECRRDNRGVERVMC